MADLLDKGTSHRGTKQVSGERSLLSYAKVGRIPRIRRTTLS